MDSPFPGMDPYLEQHWRDVHHNLITFIQGALNSQLPEGLIVRVEERVFLESDQGSTRSMYPDVRVIERGQATKPAQPEGGIALAEPVTVHRPIPEPLTEGFIEIIDVGSGHRVVTVIEVLSPTNKMPGEGQELYLRKQRDLLRTDVNLVEIDLLRGGERVLVIPPRHLRLEHQTPYHICVRSGCKPQELEVCPIKLQERFHVFASRCGRRMLLSPSTCNW